MGEVYFFHTDREEAIFKYAYQEGQLAMRGRAATAVRAFYDDMCECDRVADGPHRLSCEAGIGDDLAEALRALEPEEPT